MNQAIRVLFFLVCVCSLMPCQAMEEEEKEYTPDSSNGHPAFNREELRKEFLHIKTDANFHEEKKDSEETEFSKKYSFEAKGNEIPMEEHSEEKNISTFEFPRDRGFSLINVMDTITSEEIQDASLWDRALIAQILSHISQKEDLRRYAFWVARSYFFEGNIPLENETGESVRSFCFEQIDGFDFRFLLNLITLLSPENWSFFSSSPPPLALPPQVTDLTIRRHQILPAKDLRDRLLLLDVFSKIPSREWNSLISQIPNKTDTDLVEKVRTLVCLFHFSKIPSLLQPSFKQYISKKISDLYFSDFIIEFDPQVCINLENKGKLKEVLEYLFRFSPFSYMQKSLLKIPENIENYFEKVKEDAALLTVFCQISLKEDLLSIVSYLEGLIENRVNMSGKANIVKAILDIPLESRDMIISPARSFIPENMK